MQKILRFRDLKERGVVNNWPTLLRWIEKGHFPPGHYVGPNTNTRIWTEQELEEWCATRPSVLEAKPKIKGRARKLVEAKAAREAAAHAEG